MRLARDTLVLMLSLATSVLAKGGVVIHNHCPFPVHSCSVTVGKPNIDNVIAPGERHYQEYIIPPVLDGTFGGTSLKLGKVAGGAGPITQLEYTWASGGIGPGMMWYDLSNVDCGAAGQSNQGPCPFVTGGMHLAVGNNPKCANRKCPSGNLHCDEVYYLPMDNYAATGCDNTDREDLVMQLCLDRAPEEAAPAAPVAQVAPKPKHPPKKHKLKKQHPKKQHPKKHQPKKQRIAPSSCGSSGPLKANHAPKPRHLQGISKPHQPATMKRQDSKPHHPKKHHSQENTQQGDPKPHHPKKPPTKRHEHPRDFTAVRR